MSQNPSFCEISIEKDEKIILTIDLSQDENSKKMPLKKTPSDPEALYNLLKSAIYHLHAMTDETPPPEPPRKISKTIRKLAKKIIKVKKLRLTEIAADIGVDKNNLKHWFMKGENPPDDQNDYVELLKGWILDFQTKLSFDDICAIINRFNKSLAKGNKKSGEQKFPQKNFEEFENVLLDNSFPRKRVKEDNDSTTGSKLHLINIDVEESAIRIKESLLWNIEDSHPVTIEQFAFNMVKDVVDELRLNPPEDVLEVLIEKIEDQIMTQIDSIKSIKDNIYPLIGFNANNPQFRQKECVCKIKLYLKEGTTEVKDSFDWEINPKLNDPDIFARQYVTDSKLPQHFVTLVSAQIRRQINDALQKKAKNLAHLYENVIEKTEDSGKTINEHVKPKILHSLNENIENMPLDLPDPSKIFLKNAEMFQLVSKYTDYLSPNLQNIFFKQKALIEARQKAPEAPLDQNSKIKIPKPSPFLVKIVDPNLSIQVPTTPHGVTPTNLSTTMSHKHEINEIDALDQNASSPNDAFLPQIMDMGQPHDHNGLHGMPLDSNMQTSEKEHPLSPQFGMEGMMRDIGDHSESRNFSTY